MAQEYTDEAGDSVLLTMEKQSRESEQNRSITTDSHSSQVSKGGGKKVDFLGWRIRVVVTIHCDHRYISLVI